MTKPANKHMQIWDEVKETALSHTKTAALGGRTVTSINGTYMVRRATEIFGPAGTGWGWEVIAERFDQGAPIFVDKVQVGHEVMHTIHLKLWYMADGERREISHYGHTPYIQSTKYGPRSDMDAPKKSMTDAIKKCLSMLGFSADIFLGMYDDAEYVAAAHIKDQIERADNADEAVVNHRAEFMAWVQSEVDIYAKVPNAAALKSVLILAKRKASRQCQLLKVDYAEIEARLNQAAAARMAELQPGVDLVCPSCGMTSHGEPGIACQECGTATIPQ
jgi:hypothetical protein